MSSDFLETASRLTLYVSCFAYIFPVLEYKIPGAGWVYLLQIVLHLSRLLNLGVLLLNIPLTIYEPFGDTVQSENSFLAKLTGFRSHITIPLLALSVATITREDDVDFVFSNVNQTVGFNLTAYLAGSLDFFTEGVVFNDDLDTLVQPLFETAQVGMLVGSLAFALVGWTTLIPEIGGSDEGGWDFRVIRNRLRSRTPTQGAAIRSGAVAGLAGVALVVELVDRGTAGTAGFSVVSLTELLYAAVLAVISFWRVLKNFRQQYTPASLVDVYLAIQLSVYVALSSPILDSLGLVLAYGFASPALVVGAWLLSYNVRLPRVIQSSLTDSRRLLLQNLRRPGLIFRLLQSVAVSAGILALMFAYYSFIGNAFEFEFSSGNAVVLVQGVVDNVEATFDGVIVDINSFIGAITPCSTTSDFWTNATALGGSGVGVISAADTLDQLRANSYFDECFDVNDEFARPPLNVDRCAGVIENYDDLVAEEAQISGLTPPSAVSVDTDFVDDEGNTLENEVFQILTIDPDCNEKLCIAFTVLTVGLFAATLIPFVNVGAALASKAARIAWRIGRIGAKMLKYVRKIYAKRSKLRRFTTLVRKLAATGRPTLKFDPVIFFLFVPMITVGLLCLLLGFFRREGGSSSIGSRTRFRVVVFFGALTLLNLALFFGLFGFDGENSLRYVQSIMDNLPSAVIGATVQYGSGMLYLRLSLLLSTASSAAMATSLGITGVSQYVGIGAAAERPQERSRPLNYAIMTMLLIVPVSYMALISYGRPEVRWFKLNALQDDRTSDIVDQIAASEVVANAMDIINEDLSEEERACGFIAVAVEEVYVGLLGALSGVVDPLLGSLRDLQSTAAELLGQVRVGTFFAPINLNLPQTDQSEFWIVFTLPLLAVVLAVVAISLDLTNRFTGSKIGTGLVGRTKGGITALGMVSFQLNVVIYAVFSALNNLDVPLFNIQLQLGEMLILALYSSIFCTTAGAALYLDSFLLTG